VPAKPEFLRLARVTAAGLASRIGFSFDEVEDLRLAIDELCYGLTGPTGRDGMVEVRYLLEDDGLVIEGEAQIQAGGGTGLTDLSQVILDALVDEHEFGDGARGPRFRLVKRRHPEGGVTELVLVDQCVEDDLGEVGEAQGTP
jgi:anti-sigma regulatory factor (Ser/Thr protein kinase)